MLVGSDSTCRQLCRRSGHPRKSEFFTIKICIKHCAKASDWLLLASECKKNAPLKRANLFMSKPFTPSWCNSPDHPWRPTRRDFIYVGVLGSFGLSLGNLFKLRAASSGGS